MTNLRNQLGNETSPYLLQHDQNPVDWWPWCDAAFEAARERDVPVLLSIGYSACHWCHVMAHESFEDPEVARQMNNQFVNIKVDREERPDIDHIYQLALQLLNQQGGWPLTMFLTHDRKPFWGGTYFPKTPRFGQPGLLNVLQRVADVFASEADAVRQNESGLFEALTNAASSGGNSEMPVDMPLRAADQLLAASDPIHGGLKGAPKFPNIPALMLLAQQAKRQNRIDLSKTVDLCLEQMSKGGIYDHLGGGYARYTVDARWLAPHFEKMLYDNALVIDMLADGYLRTANPLYRQRTEETLGWLEREMVGETGAWAAAIDADSEGREGAFYTWSKSEVDKLLEEDLAREFATAYDVTASGNWENVNIFNMLEASSILDEETEARVAGARKILFDAREGRPRPARDDKILADWNGLMIHALAGAGAAFDRPDWIKRAEDVFAIMCKSHGCDGDRLIHSLCSGKAGKIGVLDDYATMIRAALRLYELTGKSSYLDFAQTWVARLDRDFLIEDRSAYAMTAIDESDLIVRSCNAYDQATPSGNGLAAFALLRLFHITGDIRFADQATRLFQAFGSIAAHSPLSMPVLISAFSAAQDPVTAVVVGKVDGPEVCASRKSLASHNISDLVLAYADSPADLGENHPLHQKGEFVPGTILLCRAGTCAKPALGANELGLRLGDLGLSTSEQG